MSKSIQPDALLFECFAENRHFRIYASGRTEGFEGRVLVVNPSIALHDAENGRLGPASEVLGLIGIRTPEIGLIHLYRALELQFLGHEDTNLLHHPPSGLVGDSGLALDLLCGDADAGRRHQLDDIEPRCEGGCGLVEDGSGEGKEMRAANRASVAGTTGNPVVLTIHAALNTEGNSTRKPLLHEVFQARIVAGEFRLELLGGVLLLGRDGLAAVHRVYPCCTGRS